MEKEEIVSKEIGKNMATLFSLRVWADFSGQAFL